jgi:hypothetical protein
MAATPPPGGNHGSRVSHEQIESGRNIAACWTAGLLLSHGGSYEHLRLPAPARSRLEPNPLIAQERWQCEGSHRRNAPPCYYITPCMITEVDTHDQTSRGCREPTHGGSAHDDRHLSTCHFGDLVFEVLCTAIGVHVGLNVESRLASEYDHARTSTYPEISIQVRLNA